VCDRLQAVCRLSDGTIFGPVPWTAAGGLRRARCGPLELTLRLRPGPRGVVAVGIEAQALATAEVAEVELSARIRLGDASPGWVLANGYQSWDASGWSRADRERTSWWTVGLADERGGGLAAAAVGATTSCIRFQVREGCWALVWCQAPGLTRWPAVFRADAGDRWQGEEVRVAAAADLGACMDALIGPGTARPVPTGWLSWYGCGPFVTLRDVLANSEVLAQDRFRRLGYRLVQVDDGWQVAYGDWWPNARFPGGLEELCQELTRRGQVLGLWTAPFLVSTASDLARDAPDDWFVADPEGGGRAVDPLHRVFGPMHVLDASRPAVRKHLEELYAGLARAGVRYFKVDFLYAGAYAGVAALRAGMEAIRRGAGDAYLLACGAPLLPMAGLVDGCRVGADTATPVYDPETGLSNPALFGDELLAVARNAAARHHLRGWFQLDPDVALVGEVLSEDQARQLVSVVALSGGPFFASDDLVRLARQRQWLLTNPEVLGLVGGEPAVPDWEPESEGIPSHWRRDGVLAVFNWGPEDREVPVRAPGAVGARDLWAGTELQGFRDGARLLVPAQGVRLLRLRC
jgi:alpha-galactosidase